MPTDTVTKIGATNSPVTMDYSTLQAWWDDCPADLTATDERWIGECYDQGLLQRNSSANTLVMSGVTTDSTRYPILRCTTGASFRDKAGVRSTALYYDNTNGVAVENGPGGTGGGSGCVSCSVPYSRIIGLQCKSIGGTHGGGSAIGGGGTGIVVEDCISWNAAGYYACLAISSGAKANNCLGLSTSGAGAGGSNGIFNACTFILLSGTGEACRFSHNQGTINNCAFFGYSSMGVSSGGDYNATDLATSFSTGSNNLNSLTFADQFESTTNDFRVKAGADLISAGIEDLTNYPEDISGFTRDDPPAIGAWEYDAGGGGDTYDETVAEGAEAGDTNTTVLSALGSITDGAESGDTYSALGSLLASQTDGAESGDTNAGGLVSDATLTEGAESGDAWLSVLSALGLVADQSEASDTNTTILSAIGTIAEGAVSSDLVIVAGQTFDANVSEGAESGDTNALTLSVVCTITDGAESSDTNTTILSALSSTADGAESGDTHTLTATIGVSLSEGAVSSDLFIVAGQEFDVSVVEGAESGDTNTLVLSALGSVSDVTEAGDTNTTVLSALAIVSNGTVASDTYLGGAVLVELLTEGAESTDLFLVAGQEFDAVVSEGVESGDSSTTVLSAVASVSETVVSSDIYTTILTTTASIVEGAIQTVTFVSFGGTQSNLAVIVEFHIYSEVDVQFVIASEINDVKLKI